MIALLADNWNDARKFALRHESEPIEEYPTKGRIHVGYVEYLYIYRADDLMAREISGFIIIDGFYSRKDSNEILELAIARIRKPEVLY